MIPIPIHIFFSYFWGRELYSFFFFVAKAGILVQRRGWRVDLRTGESWCVGVANVYKQSGGKEVAGEGGLCGTVVMWRRVWVCVFVKGECVALDGLTPPTCCYRASMVVCWRWC